MTTKTSTGCQRLNYMWGPLFYLVYKLKAMCSFENVAGGLRQYSDPREILSMCVTSPGGIKPRACVVSTRRSIGSGEAGFGLYCLC